jgi:hypothetical protein
VSFAIGCDSKRCRQAFLLRLRAKLGAESNLYSVAIAISSFRDCSPVDLPARADNTFSPVKSFDK